MSLLYQFMDKKHSEGSSYKVYMMASANKFLDVYKRREGRCPVLQSLVDKILRKRAIGEKVPDQIRHKGGKLRKMIRHIGDALSLIHISAR